MNRIFALLVGALLAWQPAQAINISYFTLGVNYDNTLDTEFQTGNKPQPVTCPTWACDNVGDAVGNITETSATTLDFQANGSSDLDGYEFAHKTFASGDVQVCARITKSNWTGSLTSFAGFGVKITEGLASPTWLAQNWIAYTNDQPRFKRGTPSANAVALGDAATTSPEYLCETFKDSTDTFTAFQSDNGVDWTIVGAPEVHTPAGTLYAGAFGTSDVAGVTTFATLTNVTATSTITVTGTQPPPVEGTCIDGARALNDTLTIGTGPTRTADMECGDTDDIVAGIDMESSAATSVAPRSGTFGTTTKQPYFKGKWRFKCDIDWWQIETSDGVYNWTAADACIRGYPSQYDGVHVNLRGTVKYIDDCTDTAPLINFTNPDPNDADAKLTSQWTTPAWLSGTNWGAGCKTNGSSPYEIHGPSLAYAGGGALSTVQSKYLALITAFANRYKNDDASFSMHVQSGSQGEECCGSAPDAFLYNTTGTNSDSIIEAWATAFGPSNIYKIAYLKEDPAVAANGAIAVGAGLRGGIIENWLRPNYTPGQAVFTGQTRDSNGYLTVDDLGFPIIAESRTWFDENEECGGAKFTAVLAEQQRCYWASMVRSAQMWRLSMWIDSGMNMNGRLDDWMSLQEGKSYVTNHEAWVWLMETRAIKSGGIITIKNMERGLRQRETLGATTPSQKLDLGYDATGGLFAAATDALCNYGGNSNCKAAAFARKGASIGIAVEDRFWPVGLTQAAALKVAYICTADKTLTIKNSGGSTIATVNAVGNANVRTATRFFTNFTAPVAGNGKDFSIDSDGTCDIIFVRLIKNGNGFPVL